MISQDFVKSQQPKAELSAVEAFVISFGAMIGWGWVILSGKWIQDAGVFGAIIGFIIGGTMIYFVGMVYGELMSAMPKSGGEGFFSYKAFGRTGAFACTWMLILSYIGVVCFEAVSVSAVVSYVVPLPLAGMIVTSLFILVITVINLRAVKAAAVFQEAMILLLAAVGIIFAAGSAVEGTPENLHGRMFVGDGVSSIRQIFSVAVVSPFFLFGFDTIPQVVEEAHIPPKKLAGVLLFSIVCAVLFYVIVILAIGYTMTPKEFTAVMQNDGLLPVHAMGKIFGSIIMEKVLIIAGLCGVLSSWNSFLIAGSRAIFFMADSGMLPAIFSRLHPKYGTPVNAVLFISLLSAISAFFGKVMIVWISDAASFACCVTYCITAISFMVLRQNDTDMLRPYKVKHYRFVGIAASALSGFMALTYMFPIMEDSFLAAEEFIIIVGWIFLGAFLYAVCCKNIKIKDI